MLVHSTWDYHDDPDRFLAWTEHVAQQARLCNPHPVLAWNAHKRYLLDLEDAGVPVVPTAIVERSNPEPLACVADRRGWRTVVVKPTVSAGAKSTGRFDLDDPAGERALAEVLRSTDAIVQPYLPEIEVAGETSIVVIGNEITHAVAKVPAAGDFRVQVQFGGGERAVEPTAAERELAAQAVAAVSSLGPIAYARVDCVTVDGRPLLMELEVIEPALFLSFAGDAVADRLIACLMAHADARQ